MQRVPSASVGHLTHVVSTRVEKSPVLAQFAAYSSYGLMP